MYIHMGSSEAKLYTDNIVMFRSPFARLLFCTSSGNKIMKLLYHLINFGHKKFIMTLLLSFYCYFLGGNLICVTADMYLRLSFIAKLESQVFYFLKVSAE